MNQAKLFPYRRASAANRISALMLSLLLITLLAGCAASPIAPEVDIVPAAGEQSATVEQPATVESALAAAATAPAAAHEGVQSPSSEATEAAGPVPPIAPVAIGDGVEDLVPTPIFLPTVSSAGGGTVPGTTIPASTIPAAAGGDVAPPNAALVESTAGPAFSWQETENYLILGTDRRSEEGSWRTDSIMVVGLDRANNRAAVFSIPRDLYVNIPGYGWGRINQADYMGERREENGGAQLVGEIVLDVLGIPTQHFVRIQMDGFVDFVDALGGVNIYLDCPFSEPIFNLTTQSWTRFVLPAGDNHLDGEDAYWFARLRLEGSDIGRSSRQRAIIWAMRDQILSTNALLRLPELYSAFNDTISTDLGLFDIVSLAQVALGLDAGNVRASGLTLRDLQNFVTDGGAQVLVIGDAGRVREIVENVWDAPAMANAFRGKVAGCAEPVEPEPLPSEPPADEGDQGNVVGGDTAAAPAVDAVASGTITDPVSGIVFDAATGFPIDPVSGLPVDPATGEAVRP